MSFILSLSLHKLITLENESLSAGKTRNKSFKSQETRLHGWQILRNIILHRERWVLLLMFSSFICNSEWRAWKNYFLFHKTVCFSLLLQRENIFLLCQCISSNFPRLLANWTFTREEKKSRENIHFTKFALCKCVQFFSAFLFRGFMWKALFSLLIKGACMGTFLHTHFFVCQRTRQSHSLWKPITLWIKQYDSIAHIDFFLRGSQLFFDIHFLCLLFVSTGLRKVYPYYFTFTTFTKGRWVGEKILDVFAREFRAHPAEEYERCIKAGTLTVNYEKVPIDYKLKHNDLLANIVHR